MLAAFANATEDTTTTLYRAAIGPVETDYYLRVFAALDDSERPTLRWNWAACLCTLNWFVFRKLWRPALYHCGVVVALALFIFGIGGLVFQLSDTVQLALVALFGGLLFVLPGLFGNRIYHTECRRRMTQALRSSDDDRDAVDTLLAQASTRRRLFFVVLVNAVLLALLLGFAALWMEWASATSTAATPDATAPLPGASAPSTPSEVAFVAASMSASAPVPAMAEIAGRSAQGLVQTEPASAESHQVEGPKATASQAETSTVTTSAPIALPTAVKAPIAASRPQAASRTVKPFVVNVGLFAAKANGARAYAKLKAAGLPATSQTIATSKGPRIRVRVGPFATRQEAQQAQDRIRALSLEAVVFEQ